MIDTYNKLIEEIVWKWYIRYAKELYELEENQLYKTDIRIMWYNWVLQWPVECSDRFFTIDEILLCEANNIPCRILQKYYDKRLDLHMENKELGINLYNYWLRKKNNQKYYEDEFENLKKSKENVKKAKEELENIIKGSK